MPILHTLHTASQADGKTKMSACGEIHVTITKGSLSFMLEAVVAVVAARL